jgi:hypothetical protein
MKILSASNDRYVSLADISFPTARRESARLSLPRITLPEITLPEIGAVELRRSETARTRSSVDLPLVCDATIIGRR